MDQGPPSVEAEKTDFGYLVLFSRVDKFRHFKMEIILMVYLHRDRLNFIQKVKDTTLRQT